MGWPYEFADLTEAQKHQRRTLLDTYGLIAQASAGVVLLAIQLVFLVQWISRKRSEENGPDVPSSPHIKHSNKNQSGQQSIGYWWRRFSWWAGEPCTIFNNYIGTRGQITAAILWALWLLGLCFAETGKDYLHLTKRFGIVGASQLPFHYLLIWKSSWSPIQVLTRASHETLNAYHQLLGRVVTYLVILHAAFYLNFYVQNNLMASKIKEAYVLCGIVAVVAFVTIGTTALGPVRRWSYRVFYAVHVALATALLPALFFHVSHIRIYLYETLAVYVLNVTVRWVLSRELRGSIISVPDTSLVEITIPMDYSKASKQVAEISAPGQHAYVSLGRKSLLRVFRSNPFTVASIPGADKTIKFVARVADGNTRSLLASAEGASADTKTQLTLEGPYGLNTHEDRLMQYDRVLFVAGGVGATFIVPLYRQLLADLSPSKGSYRRQKVSCVWIARSKAEITWAIPKDQREKEGFTERLKICLTGVNANGEDTFDQEDEAGVAVGQNEDSIELEEQKQLLSGENNAPTGRSDLPLHFGRPDLRPLVDQTFSHGGRERIAIIVCGPKSLSQNLRRKVTPWVKRGREVWFHDEGFSL